MYLQGRELLELDLAEAPALPLSEIEQPLRSLHLHGTLCTCERCAPTRRDR